jgi:hypothetical protein
MKAKIGPRHNLLKSSGLRKTENMHNSSQLFLVRLWPDDEGGMEWHGKVQHVTSGEADDFCGLPMLLSNLQAMLPQIESAKAQDVPSE